MKWTALCPGLIPDEQSSFLLCIDDLTTQTLHILALTAKQRRIETGVEIVLLNTNGRFFRIHKSEVIEGAYRFAEVTAAAFFFFHPNSH